MFTLVYEAGGLPSSAIVWQHRDGALRARIESEAGEAALRRLRWLLALDVDTTPFVRGVADDPLLGRLVARRAGYRPLRTATVEHAMARALCAQLITSRAAAAIERRVVWATGRRHGRLWLAPDAAALSRVAPATLVRAGMSPARAALLCRLARTLPWTRLADRPTAALRARLEAEPGIGPWSSGHVVLWGLGRLDHGPVGDLGLLRVCSALLGRRAEVEDTERLVAPYGEWSGLAAAHLLHHPLAGRRHPAQPIRSLAPAH